MVKERVWGFAAVSALLVIGAAHADGATSEQYRACDGYGAASSEGDGMTEYATYLFIFSPPGMGNTDRARTRLSIDGVLACNAAISDLSDKHWMRKLSLLRARAIHYMAYNSMPEAMKDLDAADAIAAEHAGDAFFARSLGWGLSLTRAYAVRRMGEQAKSTELALSALALRPYNRQTAYTALLAMGPYAGEEAIQKVETALARFVPDEIDNLYIRAIDTGRFADAIALYPQLVPPQEIGDLYLRSNDYAGRQWRDFLNAQRFWSSRAGAYAYALLATGKPAEARAALQAERDRLARATEPPPPLDAKKAKDSEAVALQQGTLDARARALAECTKIIDEWTRIMDLRTKVDEGKVDEVIAAVRAEPLPKSGVSVEFLDALEAHIPKGKKPSTALSAKLRDALLSERPDVRMAPPEEFLNDLPEAETASRRPDYSAGSGPWFGGTDDSVAVEGYRAGKPDADGVRTIRFKGSMSSPASMIEEVALLRAAELARQEGKKGIIILGRQDIRTTVTTTYYSVALRTDPGGFETALRVAFVDPAALPEKYKDAAWRVIDADDVYNNLAPIYIKKRR